MRSSNWRFPSLVLPLEPAPSGALVHKQFQVANVPTLRSGLFSIVLQDRQVVCNPAPNRFSLSLESIAPSRRRISYAMSLHIIPSRLGLVGINDQPYQTWTDL